ncbi:ALG6, ALG8 glycosyltransferase [Gloeophyllum trabeum ATCC 11539]|uniref:Alpha-1,3-glucosyltransferase n=1 Tax=Gloeophyllum trabeum (strain ATCC 11539 / FP-39264 / Madison 617) TaxID=670483 RepID=S7Q513_GLOTA|nr:ALG6, ALG8 glycosyltransferase [Gloeophyllum trabeum ATCC 11539]EPQ54608.1 ALG6, ALG8 glycosyltransferase [Gloeophyllum trabeum ATCC 11539]
MRAWVLPCVLLGSVLVKWAMGLGSYSAGQGTPPLFGDYEAQRHWMEITVHLPVREWYTYDLQYWGLDYPPLTAYVSWLCGIVGSWFDPAWFALDRSRGIETPGSKVYMRATVLALDTLVYLPAVLLFTRVWHPHRSKRSQVRNVALITVLLQPALLLIDFGHFQYNSVMLGFTLLALNCFAKNRDLLGAFFFVLSLGFKQMALYYAPAIGSYLIGKCIYLGPKDGLQLFIRLAFVTSVTFLLLFLPWLPPFAPPRAILDPVSRIFPFDRGLFEDKVANFWCASNVVFKWRAWLERGALVKLSAGLTALGFLPAVVTLSDGTTPVLRLLPYALLTSSMAFFLFSFQVHEKTILLPLLPVTLLLSGAAPDSGPFAWCALVNNVAVFSMWPLLKKDGLGTQYLAAIVMWNRVIGYRPFRVREGMFVQYLSMVVYVTLLLLHVLEMLVPPPARYPDLFAALNVLASTPVFVLTWLWSIKCGAQALWALGGLGAGAGAGSRHKRTTTLSPVKEGEERVQATGLGFGVAGEVHQRRGSKGDARTT